MDKREKIKNYISQENYIKAMSVASSLRCDKNELDLKKIQTGYSYLSNPSFYSYLDMKKRQDVIDEAIYLLKIKFA
jgi:hypothetical protein